MKVFRLRPTIAGFFILLSLALGVPTGERSAAAH
jgi:hypothetical protein